MIDSNLIVLLNNLTMKKVMRGLDGEAELELWLSLSEMVTSYAKVLKGELDVRFENIEDTDSDED